MRACLQILQNGGMSWIQRWWPFSSGSEEIHTSLIGQFKRFLFSDNDSDRDAVVFTCVKVLAESIGQLPLNVYYKKNGYRSVADDLHLHELLHNQPNQAMCSVNFRELLQTHLLYRGNAYIYKKPGTSTAIQELVPLNPDRVTPFCYDPEDENRAILSTDEYVIGSKIAYEYLEQSGGRRFFFPEELIHLKGMSQQGLVGLNPIEHHRQTIHFSLAAREYGLKYFENGAKPSLAVKSKKKLSKEAKEGLRESWVKSFGGVHKSHKPVILEEDMDVTTIGISNEDSQFLESRKYQRSEIAGIYRVPAHMINDLDRATFNNIEHLSTMFVVHTLLPWIRRWEQTFENSLLTPNLKKAGARIRFNVDGLLRGDSKSRGEYYQSRFMTGSMSPNDIRRMENENPIDGGDEYYVQGAMVPIKLAGKERSSE